MRKRSHFTAEEITMRKEASFLALLLLALIVYVYVYADMLWRWSNGTSLNNHGVLTDEFDLRDNRCQLGSLPDDNRFQALSPSHAARFFKETEKTLWSWRNETEPRDIHDVLRDRFDYRDKSGQFGLMSNDSLSLAASPSNDGTNVLRVFYKKGTTSGLDSNGNECRDGHKCYIGAQFYAEPRGLASHSYTTLTLEYEVWFDHTFQWKKGGKLPGLWGGPRACSGGIIRDDCFSFRLMWREDGAGEVYAYVTHKQLPSWSNFCHDNDHLSSHEKHRQIYCSEGYGISLGAGSFKFKKSQWNKIRMEVHLNSSPEQSGYVKLWVDGKVKVQINNMIMRHRKNVYINGLMFSTFYGGHNSSWACPHDTYTFYRNFRIYRVT